MSHKNNNVILDTNMGNTLVHMALCLELSFDSHILNLIILKSISEVFKSTQI